MSINRHAYRAIEAVVGKNYITDDPADCEGYRSGPGGYESGTGYERIMTRLPGAIVMPRTTEDVQKIVKICGRYGLPFVPYSTGFYGPRSHPHMDDELIIDMKRMRDFEIDGKHFFITVQPGVIYSQIQQECFEKGAYVVVGGGGAQTSAVANLLNDGWSPLSFRIGLPQRRILGMEIVMPDGEIVKMGSLADGDDPFWGEGIGPDLRGIMRGYTGLLGCLGICTKMAIKTLPFQPDIPKPAGISPDTALQLNPKRVRWINFTMPSLKSIEDAHIMIGNAEIGAAVTKVPTFWRAIAKAECKEEFWDLWLKETEESVANFFLVRVLLIGYTSEEQMDYDYHVLCDIIEELGGKERRTKPSDESWFKNADSAGMWLMTGSYVSVDYVMDSFTQAFEQGPNYRDLKDRYTPPLMPDCKDLGWFQSLRDGASRILRISDLLGSARGHRRHGSVLRGERQDEYRKRLLSRASELPPAAVSDRTGLRSQLSPVDSRPERDLRSPVDLSSASSACSRRIREEGRLDAGGQDLGDAGGIPLSGQPESENELIFSIYHRRRGRENRSPALCVLCSAAGGMF